MSQNQANEKVLVLDFGAQYAQLIARRVRDLHVYSEIVPCDISADEIRAMEPSALILSGGPASVYADDAPSVDPAIFDLGLPILGFCYGHQITAVTLGGEVGHSEVGEYGPATIERDRESALFNATPLEQTVWMSHRDAVSAVPEGFVVTASTSVCPVAAMENAERRIFTTQFHPEVKHTEYGQQLLKNFLFNICGLEDTWTMDNLVETMTADFRAQVGEDRVILALSGGVDSSVVAAMLIKAIGQQLVCVHVNHGLMRKNESEGVVKVFRDELHANLIYVDATERFLGKLDGVADPEEKRKIIGGEFIRVFEEEARKLEGIDFLGQGTIYPDIIESGTKTAKCVKSHHNVGGLPEDLQFELVEPLKQLFKDEVRACGIELGLPAEMVYRQPFPGPGLGVRCLGAITRDRLEALREADAILRDEFAKSGLDKTVWQYFVAIPDFKAVGVRDNARSMGYMAVIRAVNTIDAMTATIERIDYDLLERIADRITAEVTSINRVVYEITKKPVATIEFE